RLVRSPTMDLEQRYDWRHPVILRRAIILAIPFVLSGIAFFVVGLLAFEQARVSYDQAQTTYTIDQQRVAPESGDIAARQETQVQLRTADALLQAVARERAHAVDNLIPLAHIVSILPPKIAIASYAISGDTVPLTLVARSRTALVEFHDRALRTGYIIANPTTSRIDHHLIRLSLTLEKGVQ
ncbi:MAG: hypothetical protein ACYDA1_01735, partial [Vulcanimicrobiaceae bacterium]